MLVYHLVRNWKSYKITDKGYLLGAIISIGVAIGLYFTYNWYRFDNFFLYLDFQSQPQYAHRMRLPFITIYEALDYLELSQAVAVSLIFTMVIMLLFYTKKNSGGVANIYVRNFIFYTDDGDLCLLLPAYNSSFSDICDDRGIIRITKKEISIVALFCIGDNFNVVHIYRPF